MLPGAAFLLQNTGLSPQPGRAGGQGIGLSIECGNSVYTLQFREGHDRGGSWQMMPWPGSLHPAQMASGLTKVLTAPAALLAEKSAVGS